MSHSTSPCYCTGGCQENNVCFSKAPQMCHLHFLFKDSGVVYNKVCNDLESICLPNDHTSGMPVMEKFCEKYLNKQEMTVCCRKAYCNHEDNYTALVHTCIENQASNDNRVIFIYYILPVLIVLIMIAFFVVYMFVRLKQRSTNFLEHPDPPSRTRFCIALTKQHCCCCVKFEGLNGSGTSSEHRQVSNMSVHMQPLLPSRQLTVPNGSTLGNSINTQITNETKFTGESSSWNATSRPIVTTQNTTLSTTLGDFGSGSGAGQPLLSHRRITHQIQLQKLIGRGRFGIVHEGLWYNERVAVKIFQSHDESSFQHECDIYNAHLLHHQNILDFKGADVNDKDSLVQHWLITEYHPRGSLFDYLTTSPVTLSVAEVVKMIRSIVNGLTHLHIEVSGQSPPKWAIAHGDIKSRNILMKNDGECAIADFGFAVRYASPEIFKLDAQRSKFGTKRYLPPERLNETFDRTLFDSYRSADIYSTSLVFWEIMIRCGDSSAGIKPFVTPREAMLPYDQWAPGDPTEEEMHNIVCERGLRPPIPDNWCSTTHSTMDGLRLMLAECWHESPAVRMSALLMQKTLQRVTGATQP